MRSVLRSPKSSVWRCSPFHRTVGLQSTTHSHLHRWTQNSHRKIFPVKRQNQLSILEPDFPYHQVLAPFQPLAMKAIYCPIETSLNFQQANKLLKDLKPANIVIPDSYTQPPAMAPHKTDLVIDQVSSKSNVVLLRFMILWINPKGQDRPLITFKHGEVIKLPLKRKRNRVFLTPEVAATIIPREVKPGVNLSTLTGYLQVKDNLHNITVHESRMRQVSLFTHFPFSFLFTDRGRQ